jgi:ribokinase
MVKIAVLASFNMDLVMRVERRPAAGETLQGEFAMHLGGKGFNQAVAARRLGAEVVVCGRVGDDEFGRRFLAALDDEGIDRRAVVVDPEAGTGVATIFVEPDGTNTIVQSPRANLNTTPAQVERALPLLSGSAMAMTQRELSPAGTQRFLELMRGRSATFFNPAPMGDVPEAVLGLSEIVVANEIEARTLLGLPCTTVEEGREAAQALRARGRRIAVVTMGGEGSVGASEAWCDVVPGFSAPVVDTTGAGDAFCGALALRLAEGADLADAMRFANAAGALACTKHGAYPSMPYRAEVEALVRDQGGGR